MTLSCWSSIRVGLRKTLPSSEQSYLLGSWVFEESVRKEGRKSICLFLPPALLSACMTLCVLELYISLLLLGVEPFYPSFPIWIFLLRKSLPSSVANPFDVILILPIHPPAPFGNRLYITSVLIAYVILLLTHILCNIRHPIDPQVYQYGQVHKHDNL